MALGDYDYYPRRSFRLWFTDLWRFVLSLFQPLAWLYSPAPVDRLRLDHVDREATVAFGKLAQPFRAFMTRARGHDEWIGDGFDSGASGGHMMLA